MTQPSPIGGKNSDREEEDDDFLNFCKNRPHENGGQGNNAGSNKMTSDAGAIFRSVTADDDNAPVVNDGNADFSTAILMGNLSASNSNQVKRVAGPAGWVSNAMQGVSVPMNVKQVAAHFRGQMKMPTAGVPAPMSSA
eukprot:scaffold2684_cov78-Skeletonema_marinoi.AAC.1